MYAKIFGDGGALDINRGSTSAFYIDDKTLILIDTGYGVYEKILDLHLLDKVEKVEILITHTHGDHISSLASICDYLKFMGIEIDYKLNDVKREERCISTKNSKVKVYIILTNEELMIAEDTYNLIKDM